MTVPNIALEVYRRLPHPVQQNAKQMYSSYLGVEQEFTALFESESNIKSYKAEFESEPYYSQRRDAEEAAKHAMSRKSLGRIGDDFLSRLYALVRELKPEIIIETGVGHGFSTLVLLQALNENEQGKLYSIDYPHRADIPLSEFREETYKEFGGGATIPADKDPGWIIPEPIRNRWELREGRVQRKLPQLLSDINNPIDFYLRDSEHTLPCMMFEFELAWEFLSTDGLIVSDDISHTEAFERFVESRDPTSGYITPTSGYLMRN